MTIAMFRALDSMAEETPHHEHECAEHEDVCDDECCIAAAVLSPEGWE